MLMRLFAKILKNDKREEISHRIYGTVVAQARNTALYTDFDIPDTALNRANMLSLHVFLLNNRLKYSHIDTGHINANAGNALSQEVFDLYILDIERGLRDIGFGDPSVQKRKKRVVHSYFALISEFDEALKTGDIDTMVPVTKIRYFENLPDKQGYIKARKLSQYIFEVSQFLSSQSDQAILSGLLNWPSIISTHHKEYFK